MPAVAGTLYASRTDLAQLGLVGAALVNVPPETQDAALLSACATADSYLQSRYILPLTQWGADLKRAVCHIAAYDLMTARGYGMVSGPDENVRKRYLDALAWLDEVSKGTQTPAYVVDSSSSAGGTTSSPTSGDDTKTLTSEGGLEMVTSNVRGWTPRGQVA